MSKIQQVVASAPGKLMLFGEHSVVYGYPCIATAVDRRMYVSVSFNGDDIFTLDAPDLGLRAYSKTVRDLGIKPPKSVAFVETLYKKFLTLFPQEKSIHVITRSPKLNNFGLGSSSAITVAFLKALLTFYDIKMTKKQMFDLCYQTVLDVQGVGSGYDLAVAIWGGTIFYKPPIPDVQKETIEYIFKPNEKKLTNLFASFTGVKADTPTLVRMVKNMFIEDKTKVLEIFKKITSLVLKVKKYMLDENWKKVGQIMNENHKLLKKLNVSSFEIEKLVNLSLKYGSYGSKLSGAGGGDCIISVCNQEQKQDIQEKMKKIFEKSFLDLKFNCEGVKVEKVVYLS